MYLGRMPRTPRLCVKGQIRHIVFRGNRHQDVFERPAQWGEFLDTLAQNANEAGMTLYAYCLMPNHGHLLARLGDVPLGTVMQKTLTRFALRSNRYNGRSGHLFQGRYKAPLVADDAQAKVALRYIHRNPVEACLAEDPADWPWSSHRAYAGLAQDPYVDTGFMLSLFSDDPQRAVERYGEFMAAADEGRDSGPVTSLERLADMVCSQENMTAGELSSGSRRREAVQARLRFMRLALSAGFSVPEVAEFLGVHRATVFRAQRA